MLLDTLPVLLVTIAVLFLPGGTVAAAAGLRLPLVLAAAPLTSYGLAAVAATAASVTDLRWGPGFLAAEAGALGAVLVTVRAVGGRNRPHLPRIRPLHRGDAAVVAGVLLGAVLSGSALLAGFGGIDRPNQDWDYTLHANATRFIADTGQVSASALRVLNDWEAESFFYPNAHAAIGAVVRDLTGAPVFAVLNTQILLLGGLTGLGLAVLLRDLGAPLAVTATTPVLLAGFASFPYDLARWGPVLPYATGLALIPAFLTLVRALLHERGPRRAVAVAVVLALGGAALLGLQPSTFLSATVLALLMVGQRWWTRRRIDGRDLALGTLAGVLMAVVAAPAVLGSLRAGTVDGAMNWPARMNPLQAAARLLLLSHGGPHPRLVLALLVFTGLLGLRSARCLWWWLAGSGLAVLLFVLVASSDADLVEALSRPWWNDRWRLAALAVLGMAPLAAMGLVRLSLALDALLRRVRAPRLPRRRRAAVTGLTLAVAVLLSNGLYWAENGARVARLYRTDRYLNASEVTAMDWLARRVQPGETVMNDSPDGSAFLYALEGVRPLFGHVVASPADKGPTQALLLERFHCLDSDVAVREAIDRLGVRYVFLGTGFVNRSFERVQGLRQLSDSPSLRLVYDRDGVQVYEVALRPVAEDPVGQCVRPAR